MSVADVVVVGAGPAGAHTACTLAGAGADVILVDRARFPRTKPCAEFLSPECARILQGMGVLERCEASEHALLTGMSVRTPDGLVISGRYRTAEAVRLYHERALSIQREILDTILVERAAERGARVMQRTRVTDLLFDVEGRACGVRTIDERGGARDIRARVVVGADGLRSVVARRLSLTRRWPRPRRLGIVGHWEGVSELGDVGEMHVERDGYAGLANVGGGVANISLVIPLRHARGLAGRPEVFYEEWLRARRQLSSRLRAARRTGPVLVTGPFATRTRRAWAPGAALVGDAAGYFDPFTGEGVHGALRGSELLCGHLLDELGTSGALAVDEALRHYHRTLRRELRPKRIVEGGISLFVSSPPLIHHAAIALTQRPWMADLLVGVCGDFVSPRRVLDPRYILSLVALPLLPSMRRRAAAAFSG